MQSDVASFHRFVYLSYYAIERADYINRSRPAFRISIGKWSGPHEHRASRSLPT